MGSWSDNWMLLVVIFRLVWRWGSLDMSGSSTSNQNIQLSHTFDTETCLSTSAWSLGWIGIVGCSTWAYLDGIPNDWVPFPTNHVVSLVLDRHHLIMPCTRWPFCALLGCLKFKVKWHIQNVIFGTSNIRDQDWISVISIRRHDFSTPLDTFEWAQWNHPHLGSTSERDLGD